jgi:competence protein ComFC
MAGVLPLLADIRGKALDLLFPPKCVGCGGGGSFLCRSCRASLPWIEKPVCPGCGRSSPAGGTCPDCRASHALGGIAVAFRFEGAVRQGVHHFKYRNLRALAAPLAELMAQALPAAGDVLVPLPLHRRRLRERGYNQSALLAAELSRLAGIELSDGALIRRTATDPQAKTASLAERRRNVAGAFAAGDDRLRGRRVLLVDDVTTSGATLEAGAEALREIGAESVWGLVLAREV